MKKNLESIKRRKFLKKTIKSGAFVATLPILKFFPFAASVPDCSKRDDEYNSGQTLERIRDIMLKYGGEFAGIKPELRRNSHGRV